MEEGRGRPGMNNENITTQSGIILTDTSLLNRCGTNTECIHAGLHQWSVSPILLANL